MVRSVNSLSVNTSLIIVLLAFSYVGGDGKPCRTVYQG